MSNNKDENSFPVLSWNSNEVDVSMKKLYEYVIGETKKAITWYDEKRRSKRVWGYSLRVSAIIVTGASGIIPVLSRCKNLPTCDHKQSSVGWIKADRLNLPFQGMYK